MALVDLLVSPMHGGFTVSCKDRMMFVSMCATCVLFVTLMVSAVALTMDVVVSIVLMVAALFLTWVVTRFGRCEGDQ